MSLSDKMFWNDKPTPIGRCSQKRLLAKDVKEFIQRRLKRIDLIIKLYPHKSGKELAGQLKEDLMNDVGEELSHNYPITNPKELINHSPQKKALGRMTHSKETEDTEPSVISGGSDDAYKKEMKKIREITGIENGSDDICEYCGGLKRIRNPTGNCDHLYYPENVNKQFKKKEDLK